MTSSADTTVTALDDALAGLRGLRIALIAPAGGISDARIDAVIACLARAGVIPVPGAHVRAHHRYLAGTRAERLADLHAAFSSPDIDAVWCLRGGYGSAHLLDGIDWARIPADRPLIGHSDITALACAFVTHGKTAIHAPVAADLLRAWGDEEILSFAASVAGLATALHGRFDTMELAHDRGPMPTTTSRLWGGNLTVLASIADLPLSPKGTQPITLLIEDVGEAAFRLERCFHQITRAPWFARVHAVVLGVFHDCVLPSGIGSLTEILLDHVDTDRIGLFSRAPVGHGHRNQAWPVNAQARLVDERAHRSAAPVVLMPQSSRTDA